MQHIRLNCSKLLYMEREKKSAPARKKSKPTTSDELEHLSIATRRFHHIAIDTKENRLKMQLKSFTHSKIGAQSTVYNNCYVSSPRVHRLAIFCLCSRFYYDWPEETALHGTDHSNKKVAEIAWNKHIQVIAWVMESIWKVSDRHEIMICK